MLQKKAKKTVPSINSQRARAQGLQINPEFCNWHFGLVQIVGSCDERSCPLICAQDHHCLGAKDLMLAKGVSLEKLIDFMGKENWELFKDHPPTMADELARLQRCEPTTPFQAKSFGFLSSTQQNKKLEQAAELLSQQLTPLVKPWVDNPESAINDLLVDLGPETLEQAQLLCGFLRSYFQAVALLSQTTAAFQDHPPEWGPEKPEPENEFSRDIAFLKTMIGSDGQQEKAKQEQREQEAKRVIEPLKNGMKGVSSMMQGLEYLKEFSLLVFSGDASQGGEKLRALASRSPRIRSQESELTEICGGVNSSRTSDLLVCPFIKALPRMDHCEDWFEGLMEILQDDPPREPLEAIVRFQLHLCHFTATWLAYPSQIEGPYSQGIQGLKEDLRVQIENAELANRKALTRWVTQRDRWLEI